DECGVSSSLGNQKKDPTMGHTTARKYTSLTWNDEFESDDKVDEVLFLEARLHAEEELKMMIECLDRSNEMIAKHLHKYEQAVVDLTIGEKIELINELKKIEDFMPMSSKEVGERMKRKGLNLDQGSAKKMKTSENVSEEDLKGMMQLVHVEEVYVEALQVKHPIIDWEIQSKGKKDYWKIIRL
nr:hypothetical protein [Tanacetum cinerariifolium]